MQPRPNHPPQTAGRRYNGPIDAFTKILKAEGLPALWRGLLPRLLRIPPGQAIVWGVSDQIVGYFENAPHP